ncbi:MAG: dihydrolipoyl dehydrogenase [Paucimonas sp.]|nr:dihydrolipoyl dehydrogenase [Paucimonas sp.]
MVELSVDVAVIGAGSAGLTAFRAASTHGGKVVLVEEGSYGTTCARVGCMPSKLLIAAANVAHGARHAGMFGIQAGPVEINGPAVMRRVQAERDSFVESVVESTQAIPAQYRLQGSARFIGATSLQVGEDCTVHARAIVIATGSRPVIPAELQPAGDWLLTSDDVFELLDLPTSVAVVGAGAIGLELGQALHRLGVRVVIYGRSSAAGQLDDPVLKPLATRLFANELELCLDSTVLGVVRTSDGVQLKVRDASGREARHEFARVLCATGRIPNVDRLDLQHAGLALDSRGVPRFDPSTMQCGDQPVFIAGDANNERPLLHEAVAQGRIAGDNAGAWPSPTAQLRQVALTIAFCEPQLATVGPRWSQLQPAHCVVGAASFDNQGRSRVIGENYGALHVYAGRDSGKLLGAQIVGPRAEHLAHLLAWALQAGMTIEQMLAMPFYHPVIEEGLRAALKDARDQLRKSPLAIEHCDDCTPGI